MGTGKAGSDIGSRNTKLKTQKVSAGYSKSNMVSCDSDLFSQSSERAVCVLESVFGATPAAVANAGGAGVGAGALSPSWLDCNNNGNSISVNRSSSRSSSSSSRSRSRRSSSSSSRSNGAFAFPARVRLGLICGLSLHALALYHLGCV